MHVNARRRALLLAAMLAMAILPACNASPASPSDSSNPPTDSPSAYRVTIALIGIDPLSIEVPVGARVTFVNNDPNFAHHMASACSEVDAVGLLQPGQSGQTAPFNGAKTCDYYDRLAPANPLRHGTIVVR